MSLPSEECDSIYDIRANGIVEAEKFEEASRSVKLLRRSRSKLLSRETI